MTVRSGDKLKSAAFALVVCGLLFLLLALAYLFLTPTTYRAYTRIELMASSQPKNAAHPSELVIFSAEREWLRSEATLDQLIQSLALKEEWSKRYSLAFTNSDDLHVLLRSKLSVQRLPDSRVLEIAVTSDDRNEPARIANELARIYLEHRQAQHAELIRAEQNALNQPWDELTHKIQAAQSNVDQLYFQISRDRATNHVQLYDPDAYQLLLAERRHLQDDYTAQEQHLADLKKLPPEDFRQALAAADTNSILTSLMSQLTKAKSTLLQAKLDHPTDSTEVKDATVIVNGLNQQMEQLLRSALTRKEADVLGLKSMVAVLDQRIQNASTNVAQATAHDAGYFQALQELKQLKDERNDMQLRRDLQAARGNNLSLDIAAEITDAAEIPVHPFTPSMRVAKDIVIPGGVLILAGVVLWLLGQRYKIVSKPKS